MAATFDRMGDSVVAAHGDSDAATRFYGAAAVLRRIPAFDTITIMIDSTPVAFNAVAIAVNDSAAFVACPMPPMDDDRDGAFECPWGNPRTTRTLFAWQPGQPPHIVQLVATSDSGGIGIPGYRRSGDGWMTQDSADTSGVHAIPARLKYFSGDGSGIWWGMAGSQMNAVQASGTPCPKDTSLADSTSSSGPSADRGGSADRDGHGWNGMYLRSASCQTATMTFQFSATVSVPPVSWWRRNTASGVHTISLKASSVPGAYVTLTLQPAGSGH